jgi:hypothetical protein
LTISAIDALLRTSNVSTPQIIELADNFSSMLKLRAQMRTNGYFFYTPSYARNAYRATGRGRLF